MLKKIDDWLRDQKRKYAIGLAFFIALATADMKNKYGQYLSAGETNDVEPNDPRFPMLINKVTAIYNKVKANPEAYKDTVFTSPVSQNANAVKEQVKQIVALKEETEALNAQVEELLDSDDDKTAEIEQLQEELDTKNGEIDQLKELLKAKGLKVMDGKDLPKTVKAKYDRIKDIVPLMAAIHAELKDTTITDEQRKEKALAVCTLDDERRGLWDDIDAYLNDYDSVLTDEKKFEYSEDPVIRGMQIANRMKRLKENITRNEEAIQKHITNKKAPLEQKARDKAAMYQADLDELNAMLNDKK